MSSIPQKIICHKSCGLENLTRQPTKKCQLVFKVWLKFGLNIISWIFGFAISTKILIQTLNQTTFVTQTLTLTQSLTPTLTMWLASIFQTRSKVTQTLTLTSSLTTFFVVDKSNYWFHGERNNF